MHTVNLHCSLVSTCDATGSAAGMFLNQFRALHCMLANMLYNMALSKSSPGSSRRRRCSQSFSTKGASLSLATKPHELEEAVPMRFLNYHPPDPPSLGAFFRCTDVGSKIQNSFELRKFP